MRVASLLPSATEIVAFLGRADDLVGITHECDYPPGVQQLPRLTSSLLDHGRSTSAEIDAHVSGALHDGSGIYHLDRDLLEQLNPDLVLTQELCEVCAVSYEEVQAAVRQRLGDRKVISLEPMSVEDILQSIELVARELGAEAAAEEGLRRLRFRIRNVQRVVRKKPRPRVYAMEWIDPPFASGHWIPELVELAGGEEVLGAKWQKSVRIDWQQILDAQPEVVVLMPCGFTVEQAIEHYLETDFPPGWSDLPAVRDGRVYAMDGNAYFAPPGPRIVDGLEVLASALHPDLAYRYMADEEAVPLARFRERLARTSAPG